MNDVILIKTRQELQELLQRLRQTPRVAVDTESNGFYAYYERICLIQLSTETDDFIVDPMAVDDLGEMKDLFADPSIEKIFHAASNDIAGLKRDFDFRFESLFDTAIACKLLGYRHLGLAHILQDQFGIELNKKWQRCDWGRRPLSDEQLRYARLDTHYLIPLRDRLVADLDAQDRWEQARESFTKVCEVQAPEPRFMGNGHIRIRGANRLDEQAYGVLRSLHLFRDRVARRRDRAPFRIMSNEALLRMASRQPQSIEQLQKIKGLPKTYRKGGSAKQILGVIRKALAHFESPPDPPGVSSNGDSAIQPNHSE